MASSSRRRSPRLGVVAATVLLVLASGCSAAPEPAPAETSARVAVDGARLQAAIEERIAAGGLGLQTVDAVLVTQDGHPVVSLYRNGFAAGEELHVWSVTKSVTSALVGIALADGLVEDLDAPLAQLLPEHRKQMSAELASVTLRQLMTMTAGFADERQDTDQIFDVFDVDDDAVGFILRRGLQEPPGTRFAYSSSSAHLVTAVLAAALERVDGKQPRSVLEYAQEKLFAPLEIDTTDAFSGRVSEDDHDAFDRAGFGWGTDAQGINSGCCLLKMAPADLVKLGELYLGDGTWHGRQVLPPGWVAQSVAPGPTTSQYGLMWWLGQSVAGGPEYVARGSQGQLVVVSPEDRLVIAVGSTPQGSAVTSDEEVLGLVESTVLPAFA